MNPEEIATLTRMTMEKIQNRYRQQEHRQGRRLGSATTVKYHDLKSQGYGWLLPGWVAEERQVRNGRIYRHYYDPEANLYKSQREVIQTLERMGLVVLDK